MDDDAVTSLTGTEKDAPPRGSQCGRPAYRLTDFTDRDISDFGWSHDGTRLAISRSTTINDIVLFKGLK